MTYFVPVEGHVLAVRTPAASRPAPPEASGPPRSRSAARRRCGSLVPPELSDPVGSLEVGEHHHVQQLGAGSRTEGVEALSELALELVGPHRQTVRTPTPA
jgi:hypothetical protein